MILRDPACVWTDKTHVCVLLCIYVTCVYVYGIETAIQYPGNVTFKLAASIRFVETGDARFEIVNELPMHVRGHTYCQMRFQLNPLFFSFSLDCVHWTAPRWCVGGKTLDQLKRCHMFSISALVYLCVCLFVSAFWRRGPWGIRFVFPFFILDYPFIILLILETFFSCFPPYITLVNKVTEHNFLLGKVKFG